MKSINILSFLLLSTTLSLVAFCHEFSIYDNNGNVVSPPVLDMEGEPLKINEEYSIFSALYGGGSVYLADIDNLTVCPNDVVLSSGELHTSTPVLFYPMKLGGQLVSENQDVSIKFSTSSSTKSCVDETVWKAGYSIVGPTPSPPTFIITGGRTIGIPGPNNIKNWFKIEKYETERPHSYKLRYCPTCHSDCADVGLYDDRGYTRLALNNKPYPFIFTKVNKNDA